jgi:quinol monooxygenase YgiN
MPGDEGFAGFWVLSAADGAAARVLVADLGDEMQRLREVAGFGSARLHLGADGRTVVLRHGWRGAADHAAFRDGHFAQRLRGVAGRAGVRTPRCYGGEFVTRVEGPDAGGVPGVAVLAVRHVGGRHNALALAELLERSGEWKRGFPGFISADAAISPDHTTFVNYPQWTDVGAFDAYMADPRNAAGQPEIARLEVAAPDIVRCTVVAEVIRTERS